MPPSRIAFALGDLMSEVRRLLPADGTVSVTITLDAEAYAKVGRELAEYVNLSNFDPLSASFTFGGIKVVREVVNV